MALNRFLIYLTLIITSFSVLVRTELPEDTYNLLQTACSFDDDCLTYSNAKCSSNVCSACDDSLQCDHFDSPATCNTMTGKCEIDCSTGQDVCWRQRARCENTGYCSQCETNEDCDGYPGGAAYCLTGGFTNLCVNCLDSTNCASGQSCAGYKCIECSGNGECLNLAAPICVKKFQGDFCRECGDDSHCSASGKNHCSEDNVCVQCTSQLHCADPTPVCLDGECVQCTTNNDCQEVDNGFCDLTTNTCQPCTSHSDCTHLTATPFCQSGVCDAIECTTDPECTDITKSVCDSVTTNLCQICQDDNGCSRFTDTPYCGLASEGCVECTSSSNNCVAPTSVCLDGECVQCGANNDCQQVNNAFCDLTTHSCKPCSSHSDCSHFTLNPYCQSGVCSSFRECTDDNECSDPTKSFCGSTNECQVCQGDTSCTRFPDTQYCGLASEGCVYCTSSSNNCVDPTPVCFDGECVQCATNNDCQEVDNGFCDLTTHTCQPCTSHSHCTHLTTTPYCQSGVCSSSIECTDYNDCSDPTKSFCSSTNECQICPDDTTCTRFTSTPYCGLSSEGCVECTSSTSHCAAPTPFCVDGGCAECETNNDCTDINSSFCDSVSHSCQSCSSHSDCSHLTSTPFCQGGICGNIECTADPECLDITKSFCDTTTTNQCQICLDDTSCTRFPDTQFCGLASEGCVQCTSSSNNCVDPNPVCLDGECVQCATSNDCQEVDNGFCDLTTNTCQPCTSHSDCTHFTLTPFCQSGVCSDIECLADTGCPDITKSFCDTVTTNLCQVCQDDNSCTRFTDTPYCLSSEGCVGCTSDTPCSLVTVSHCDVGGTYTCGPCFDDAHCTNFPLTPNCKNNEKCVECVDSFDCTDVTKSLCDTSLNTCGLCSTSDDCTHLTNTPICSGTSDGCVECLLSTTCTDPLKSFCDSNTCITCVDHDGCNHFSVEKVCSLDASLGCVECMTNDDCQDPGTSFCDVSSHTCKLCSDDVHCNHLPATPFCSFSITGCVECMSSTPCTDIALSNCNSGTHVCEACSDNDHCTKFSLTPLCKMNQLCVECLDSAIDCNFLLRSYCDPTSDSCTLCSDHAQCSNFAVEKVCSFDATLGCVECMTNDDCQTTERSFCDTSTHTCKVCSDDLHCTHLSGTEYCSFTATGCVECTSPTPCTDIALSTCNLGTNLCEACSDDAHCTKYSLTPVCEMNTKCVQCLDSTLHCTNQLKSYCDLSSTTCKLCTAHTDCGHFSVEKVCSFQASLGCVECMSNTDCQDPTRSYCDLSTHTCQLCSNTPQCTHLSLTPFCSLGLLSCTECLVTTHCTTMQRSYCNPTTLACQTCANDGECSHLTPTPYCSLDDARCAECLTSATCLNILKSYCNPGTKVCQVCASHAQCAHLTATPLCHSTAVGCVNCVTNNDCLDRFSSYCNQGPHSCKSCTADNQCTHITDMNKCWYGECVIYSTTCYPDYPITITQLKSTNDFEMVFSANLVAKLDIRSSIKIGFVDAIPADYIYTITKLSDTVYNVYFDVKKTIPNSKLQVSLPCPRTVTNVYGDILIEVVSKKIMYGSAELKASLNTMENAGDKATTAMSGVSSAIVFIGANPAILWALLGLIQTFYYMLFINVQYPANVQAFFPIFKIADFDFIPNPMWIIFPNVSEVQLPVPAKFEENDINGLFLDNAGNMLLLWMGNLVFYGFSFLVMRYTRNRPQVLTFICSKLVSTFEWSGTFRIFISSYMELTIAAFLQLRVLAYSTGLLASSSVTGLFFAGFGIIFPIMAYFIVKKYDTRPEYILIKFGTLIDEYKLKGTVEKYFTVMYITRNLIIAAALVYLHDYAYIQIGILTGLNLGFAFLLWRYKPYENKVSNISNFVTELVFAIVHVIIFILIHDEQMHFFNDPQRITVGWGIMIGCGIILIASIVLAFAQQYTMVKRTILLLRTFLRKQKGKEGAKGKLPEIKIKRVDRLKQSSPETDQTFSDSVDMSSTNILSSPALRRSRENTTTMENLMTTTSPELPPKTDPLEIVSNVQERKLAALQRLARLNFESRHNKVRLGKATVDVLKKQKPKSRCAN